MRCVFHLLKGSNSIHHTAWHRVNPTLIVATITSIPFLPILGLIDVDTVPTLGLKGMVRGTWEAELRTTSFSVRN